MMKPILVVMAAGMGSRYGGLKQLEGLGPNGETMLDYSISDAYKAGFRRVIFIIKQSFAADFERIIGNKTAKKMEVAYAYQALEDIPEPFHVPEERVKPWGTAHAVWSARNLIDAPFAVINADDYYGEEAYHAMFRYLDDLKDDQHYAMVGYKLVQTLSPNGAVSRGLCTLNQQFELVEIEEQTQIEAYDEGIHYTEDGINWHDVPEDTVVSMNLWGFPASFTKIINQNLSVFLEHTLRSNPLKGEFYLPSVVKKQIDQENIIVKVLTTDSRWFGVTYIEDKPYVQEQLANQTL